MTTPSSTPSSRHRLWRIVRAIFIALAAILGALLLLIVIFGLLPVRMAELPPPNPVASYGDAIRQFEAIVAAERATEDFNPECHSVLLTHGEPTAEVYVFYHGFTSCPPQYRELGQALFEQGHNVYIPLAPYHGLRDRRGMALNNLTVEDLAVYGTESADIAQGLGERVTVSGISGGGAVAAWLGQEREDIELAVPMAPFIGIKLVPGVFLNRGFTNLIGLLPNFYRWWDPISKENNPASAPYSYVGYPFRSMGMYMRLGFATLADAGRAPQAAAGSTMVINQNETSISNPVARALQEAWEEQAPGRSTLFEMPADLRLAHDFITTGRPGNDPDVIYPILIDVLKGND